MCMEFADWEEEIAEYCSENGLDYSALKKSVKSCGTDIICFLHHDESRKGIWTGPESTAIDETKTPPVILIVRKAGKGITIEQTEHTEKYLGGQKHDKAEPD